MLPHRERIFGKGGEVSAFLVLLLALLPIVLPAQSAAGQTFTEVYPFNSAPNLTDGAWPEAAVTIDSSGNLYGTTFYGGTGTGCDIYFGAGCGTVFKIDPSGAETVLHSFAGQPDGSNPTGSLTLVAAGNLYGATPYGGVFGQGTVFKLDASGKEDILHSFAGGADGARPNAGLVLDASGNLYGTTQYGGDGCNAGGEGCGTVFRISAAGENTVLYRFLDGLDGSSPLGGVALDSSGNLYGTTWLGGTYNFGTVFEISNAGYQTVLYSFAGGSDGANPIAGLIIAPSGNLYGTTPAGGAYGNGTVFEVDVAGNEDVVYNFTGGPDGAAPYDSLISDDAGNLYGTTAAGGVAGAGTVFELSGGSLAVLYAFPLGAGGTYPGGAIPMGSLVSDAAGNLYGTALQSGTYGWGDVFEIQP
ncbi:MAG: choice-of-anchor tandem repeat GloVer-containing protein [Terriglobales bacterium]